MNAVSSSDSSSLQQLLVQAREKGYVTLDDMLALFPEAEKNVAAIDDVYDMFLRAGVVVRDDDDEEEPDADPKNDSVLQDETIAIMETDHALT